jgi:hypothetical protein
MTLRLGEASAVDAGLRDPQVIEQVEIQAKYQGYIERQQEEVARSLAMRRRVFPPTSISATSRPVTRGAAEAVPAAAADAGPGVAHPGRDAGCDLDPAVCLKRRQLDAQRQRAAPARS